MPSSPSAGRLAAIALGLVVGLLAATPAAGHSDLVDSSPRPGEEVGGAITRIVMVLSGDASEPDVTLTGPDEVTVPGRIEQTAPDRVEFQMDPLTTEGEYVVHYRFLSADGYVVEAAFAFTYRAAAPQPEALAFPAADPADRPTDWTVPAVLMGLVLVAAATIGGFVVWVLRRDRVRQAASPPGR